MNPEDIDGQQTYIRGSEQGQAIIIDEDDGGVSVGVFTRGGHIRASFTREQAQAMIEALQRAMEVAA